MLKIENFILGTVGFATTDVVLSKKATWLAFSSSGLSVFSCILLWDEPGLEDPHRAHQSPVKSLFEFCLWGCGLGASTGRF